MLVGYQEGTANYRLYDPSIRRVSTARDVTFNEKAMPVTPLAEESRVFEPTLLNDEEKQVEENGVRAIRRADEGGLVDANPANHATDEEHPLPSAPRQLSDRLNVKRAARYEVNVIEVGAPVTYQEAVTGPDAPM